MHARSVPINGMVLQCMRWCAVPNMQTAAVNIPVQLYKAATAADALSIRVGLSTEAKRIERC